MVSQKTDESSAIGTAVQVTKFRNSLAASAFSEMVDSRSSVNSQGADAVFAQRRREAPQETLVATVQRGANADCDISSLQR